MTALRPAGLLALFAFALMPASGHGQAPASPPDAVAAPGAKIIGVPAARKYSAALIVLNAQGAELNGRTLTLSGAAGSAILFTSRPVRTVGHLPLQEMVDLWTTGSFARNPPNATVSVFRKDGSGVSDAVVVLRSSKVTAGKVTFDVDVLEGSLAKAEGPVAIFIDTVWFGLGSGGFTYLGQSNTKSQGQDSYPAVGNYEQQQDLGPGWVRPSPDTPVVRPNQPPPPNLAAPPGYGGYNPPQCGKPPLLPCY
jgi:hypothetical protein